VTKPSLRIIITAGPTIEPIDPVRFISNRSTGTMGYELAKEARRKKHDVTLIMGRSAVLPPRGVKFLRAEKAADMQRALYKYLKKADCVIMAAAVSDFRPASFSGRKIKSRSGLNLRLVKNPDILGSIPEKTRMDKVLVGFAMETERLLQNALRKLKEKRLDLIVANKISRFRTPFGKSLTTVYLLDGDSPPQKLKNLPKSAIARAILDRVERLCYTSVK
jgi:phosphopantothenoylcysteine decarboxylase/phosphopantothenate--cysteine ligase